MLSMKIKILGEDVDTSNDYLPIEQLKFLRDNPRVYACTHGEKDFDALSEQEQQDRIYANLLMEPSVKNLMPEIKRHDGLMEPILVRHDTMEVIEGNSRLAVYRQLNDLSQQGKEEGEWGHIPCDIVSKLSDEQQAALLNQIHVKGKTQWAAYEKANFAYVRKDRGWSFDKIAKVFGETAPTIKHRVKVIQLMKDNGDAERSHFSYYDVMVRSMSKAMEEEQDGLKYILRTIKQLGTDEETNSFTAQELRNKLPVVLKKPKVHKELKKGKITLDQAYDRAKINRVEEKVKQARELLADILKDEVEHLETGEFNSLKQAVRKLLQEATRVSKLVGGAESK